MIDKKYQDNGGKAWQREDKIDRSIPYKEWINSQNTNGFWLDADAIKWRKVNDEYVPFVITELTACEWEEISTETYLARIKERIFERDKQGHVLKSLGKLIGVPVYWVVFPPSVSWIYVYSVNRDRWKLFEPEDWVKFLQKL